MPLAGSEFPLALVATSTSQPVGVNRSDFIPGALAATRRTMSSIWLLGETGLNVHEIVTLTGTVRMRCDRCSGNGMPAAWRNRKPAAVSTGGAGIVLVKSEPA